MVTYDVKHHMKDISTISFSDYAKDGWIESKRTFLVAGSTAKGPMNNEDLPAFGSQAAADQFARVNGGHALAYEKASSELLKELGNHHAHHES